MAYCAREFFHAQWSVLLDDEFLEAWKHGIVITCCDGITRRFYPRIFSYSADYPEKLVFLFLISKLANLHQDSHRGYSKSGLLPLPTMLDPTEPCT